MFTLQPDFRFKTFNEATVEFLKENNVKGLILDIDNTLVPYEIPEPTDEVRAWLNLMSENGMKIAFL